MRNYLYFRKLYGIYSGASACKSMELRTYEKLREQHRINSQLMAFFEITRGCSLLTLTGHCALSCAGHVTHIWKVLSHFKLACPLSIYPFFKKNYSVEQFACFCF